MSNRKESLKKSLGLTEYPWSSGDEEENTQTNSAPAALTNSRQTENGDSSQPGTSVETPLLSMSPTRRNQTTTRLERDLFWSLLNNPHRSTAAGSSRHYPSPTTSSFEPVETHERVDLENPVTNLHRMFAIKRLSRNLGSNLYKHSGQRSSRNIIFAPAMHAEMANTMRFGRIRRRPMSRVPPAGCSRNSIIPAVLESPAAQAQSATHDSQDANDGSHSDYEMTPTMRSLSPENIDDNGQTRETVEESEMAASAADAPGGDGGDVGEVGDVSEVGDVTLEEGAADGGEEDRDENENGSEEAQAEQASADEDTNEDMTVQVAESAEVQPSQRVKRKRESSKDSEPDSVKSFNQSLLRLLECPVCLEWMEPPISQCRRGHLACARCRARLSSCPVCRIAFSSVRNRAMEAVAEMLRYPCRHGCGRETRLRRRAAHEASCAARRYRCPAPTCADRPPLPLSDLPHHFQTKHLPMLKVGRKHKFSMKVNSEQHDNWLVMAARELFHLRVDVDIRTWGVVVYVAYIGPKCNASNYTYEVTVTGQHNDRKLVYTRATHSDLESSSLNVSRQDCFHLTLDQALNFLRFKNRYCEPDKFLDFVVEISKREVPVETAVESDS